MPAHATRPAKRLEDRLSLSSRPRARAKTSFARGTSAIGSWVRTGLSRALRRPLSHDRSTYYDSNYQILPPHLRLRPETTGEACMTETGQVVFTADAACCLERFKKQQSAFAEWVSTTQEWGGSDTWELQRGLEEWSMVHAKWKAFWNLFDHPGPFPENYLTDVSVFPSNGRLISHSEEMQALGTMQFEQNSPVSSCFDD